MISKATLPFLALMTLSLSSCITVGPDYEPPVTVVPDTWYYGTSGDVTDAGGYPLDQWWRKFNDPTLTKLIRRAHKANPDIQIASERVREARAARGVASSQLFPFLDGSGFASRSRISESAGPVFIDNPRNNYALGFDAGWEIDIFGGTRRAIESADATEEATIEAYRDTLVTLYAEVALNYIEVRTLQRRIVLAKENAAIQKNSRQLTQDRFDAGLVPQIDVTQATTNLKVTEAAIPAFEQQLVFAKNRLASLLGTFPGSLESLLDDSKGIPTPPRSIDSKLPTELLRSRPDVRQAERQLASQAARIGVATAELYPRFSLSGFFEMQSIDADKLFESASRAWGFSPAFRWNIFNAGQIRNTIKIEESRTKQQLLGYEKAVLNALEDVENSMVAIQFERIRVSKLSEAANAADQTVDLVRDNYTNGLVNFQNVLDAERTLAQNQDSEAVSRGEVAKNYVRLYKALGGGSPPPEEYISDGKELKSPIIKTKQKNNR